MEFHTFWKIPGLSRILPSAQLQKFERRGLLLKERELVHQILHLTYKMWQANEPGHSIYPPLSKGYVEVSANAIRVICRSPSCWYHMERRGDGETCAASMFGQDLLQEDQLCPTVQMTRQKVQSNDVVSKKAEPNIERGTPLSSTWSRTMGGSPKPTHGRYVN